jgi:tetratricopeptide (TPR) repeat protein
MVFPVISSTDITGMGLIARVLIAVTVLLMAGCGSNSEKIKTEAFARGQKYAAEGKLAEAAIEFRKAIQQDERFGEARFALGEVLRRKGDTPGAFREYVRAADLLPQDVAAQVKAGEMNLLAGRFDDARTRATQALLLDPNNVDAHLLMDAIKEVETALALDPQRGLTYSQLGALQLAQGKRDEAEQFFVQATQIDPKSVQAQLALANFYWTTNDAEGVERTLKAALTLAPDDVRVNRALIAFYLLANRTADAETLLKRQADRMDPAARAALADFYIRNRRDAEAMPLLDQLERDDQWFAEALVRKASIFYGRGEKQEAFAALDRALEKKPRDVGVLVAKAQLLALDRQMDKALIVARSAVAAEPDIVPAQMVLAVILTNLRQTDDAIAAYREVVRLSPRMVTAHVELARLYLSKVDIDEGLREAREAVSLQPENPSAQLVLARAQVAKGQTTEAETTLNALAKRYPEAAAVYAQIGSLQIVKGDKARARVAYERALTLDSSRTEALGGLLILDAAEKKVPNAVRRIESVLATSPNSAPVLVVAARTYLANRDATAAEGALRRAIEIDPASLDAYLLLGSLYSSQNRIDDAVVEFDRILARNPKAVYAHTLIGMLLEFNNRAAEARGRYERALAIDPHAAVPANNLAWMLAESGQDLDTALQLAQTARVGLPDSPDVADTLGWIYFKKGLHEQAVSAFQESVAKEPNRALFQYHLGLSAARAGNFSVARAALTAALKLDPKAAEAADAQKALSFMP